MKSKLALQNFGIGKAKEFPFMTVFLCFGKPLPEKEL